MSTIYTLNSKVLKNTVNDKWLIKKIVPTDEVQIGTQIWKSKNLAIDDGQGGIYTQTVNYGQGNVVEYYYTWEAAVRIAASIPGWHLPTRAEWNTLANAVGGTNTAGTKLKSTYGWRTGNGTDDYSFGGFPSSYFSNGSFMFSGLTKIIYFWTATEHPVTSASAFDIYLDTKASMVTSFHNMTKYAFTVRLIKD